MSREKNNPGSPHPHSYESAAKLVGDHWTLLIVRRLSLNSSVTFTELLSAARGISTNILSHRLQQLVSRQLLTVDQSREDGRKLFYSLTPIGADLRPVIREIEFWGRKYSATATIARTEKNWNERFWGPAQ